MTYSLLCYKNNNSIFVDGMRGKYGLKYIYNVNNNTLYDLLSFVLQKYQFNDRRLN